MSAKQDTNQVIDLGEYRAVRDAARRRLAPPAPYLLWYPGVGYLQVAPSVSPRAREAAGTANNQPFGLRRQ